MSVEELGTLERAWSGFRMVGGTGTLIHGSQLRGYALQTEDCPPAAVAAAPGTGACCVDADCSITTEADCAGIYQGDDTVCDPNPCSVTCPDISLACDQICASRTKCSGFVGWLGISRYLTWTEREVSSQSGGADNPTVGCGPCSDSSDTTTIKSYNPDTCTLNAVVCSGGGSASDSCAGTFNYTWIPDGFGGCKPSAPNSGFGCAFCDGTFDEVIISDAVKQQTFTPSDGGDCASDSDVTTDTLSDEITTGSLIAETESALPAYDDSYADSCSASRELSMDETSYSICRFKPKFIFSTPATGDCTIHYHEHFVPDVGSPSDIPRDVSFFTGDTEVIGPEVLEPSSNGVISITDITCTCP